MRNFTIADALNQYNMINPELELSYFGQAPSYYTWRKIRGDIQHDIIYFSAIGELQKVEKLDNLLSKCPFRKNY